MCAAALMYSHDNLSAAVVLRRGNRTQIPCGESPAVQAETWIQLSTSPVSCTGRGEEAEAAAAPPTVISMRCRRQRQVPHAEEEEQDPVEQVPEQAVAA